MDELPQYFCGDAMCLIWYSHVRELWIALPPHHQTTAHMRRLQASVPITDVHSCILRQLLPGMGGPVAVVAVNGGCHILIWDVSSPEREIHILCSKQDGVPITRQHVALEFVVSYNEERHVVLKPRALEIVDACTSENDMIKLNQHGQVVRILKHVGVQLCWAHASYHWSIGTAIFYTAKGGIIPKGEIRLYVYLLSVHRVYCIFCFVCPHHHMDDHFLTFTERSHDMMLVRHIDMTSIKYSLLTGLNQAPVVAMPHLISLHNSATPCYAIYSDSNIANACGTPPTVLSYTLPKLVIVAAPHAAPPQALNVPLPLERSREPSLSPSLRPPLPLSRPPPATKRRTQTVDPERHIPSPPLAPPLPAATAPTRTSPTVSSERKRRKKDSLYWAGILGQRKSERIMTSRNRQ